MTLGSDFGIVDYLVLAGTLSFSVLIGVYYACFKRQANNEDYLLGGRRMPVVPIALSLLVTYTSSITIIGFPAEVYANGSVIAAMLVSTVVFSILAIWLYLPLFYNLKLTSVYEYLEMRFDSVVVRWLASGTFILQMILHMGVMLFAPSLAMKTFLNFPVWATILILGGCASIYTSIGGLRAVVWTDVLQSLIMLAGMLAIFIKCLNNVGGFSEAFQIAKENGRLQFFDLRFDPLVQYTTWNVFFGFGFSVFGTNSTHQPQVQRYSSIASLTKAIVAMLISAVALMVTLGLAMATGIALYANYAACDPVQQGQIGRIDQIVPFFVQQEFSVVHGMLGLFMACLFSATLSSISSGLNSLAAVMWEDFFRKIHRFDTMTEANQAIVTKVLSMCFGVLCIGSAYLSSNMGTLFRVFLTLNGAVLGPLGAVFILGVFIPFVNKWGAGIGMIVGHAIMSWICFGSIFGSRLPLEKPLATHVYGCSDVTTTITPTESFVLNETTTYLSLSDYHTPTWTESIYSISYLLYSLVGAIITVLVGIIVSLCTHPNKVTPEKEHLYHPGVIRLIKLRRAHKSKTGYSPVRGPTDSPEVDMSGNKPDISLQFMTTRKESETKTTEEG